MYLLLCMQYIVRYTKDSKKLNLIYNLLEPKRKYTISELSKLLNQKIGIISEQVIAMEKLKMVETFRDGRLKFVKKVGYSKRRIRICPHCNQVIRK
jgi:Mn-dependent DtxR family transcriptional regulator